MASVCVLILNYLTYWDTIRYVEELKRQKGIQLSILIVDNCSPNNAFEALQQALAGDPAVTLIRTGRNGGYAYGNNVGLRHLKDREPEYILISNNDVHLEEEDLLRRMTEVYRELPTPGFIAPRMYVNGREDRKHEAWRLPRYRDDLFASLRLLYSLARFAGLTNRYHFNDQDFSTQAVDCLSGSFFMGSRSVFRRLGPLDEHTFLYGEESILGQKTAALGWKNYLVRSLRFDHDHGGTTRKVRSAVRLQKFWLESSVYYQQKYNRAGAVKIGILRLLFHCWIVETWLWNLFRGRSGNKNKTRRHDLTPGLSAYTKEKKV